MRRAIDHNEKVIFQVYEQRQAAWEKSLIDAQKANGEKLEEHRKASLQQQQKLLMQVREEEEKEEEEEDEGEEEEEDEEAAAAGVGGEEAEDECAIEVEEKQLKRHAEIKPTIKQK